MLLDLSAEFGDFERGRDDDGGSGDDWPMEQLRETVDVVQREDGDLDVVLRDVKRTENRQDRLRKQSVSLNPVEVNEQLTVML